MSEVSQYRSRIDDFRAGDEDNYIFACQAAVPLVLTPDLLYQLWNNFKQYKCVFEDGNSSKIPHIAVSDLLLSPFCREVGFEVYELEKEIRDILMDDLVLNLGEKRKNTIATFLEDYAMREHLYGLRKNLKNLHLLTAQSILDPAAMEKQIIDKINQSQSDAEKINYLLLHKTLLPIGFDSDLSKISEAIPGTSNMDPWSPILVEEKNPDTPGVLHVKLPALLSSRIRKVYTEVEPAVGNLSRAQLLITESIQSGTTLLDLGNCGLTNMDLAEGTNLHLLLKTCTHLQTLILSNRWFNFQDGKWNSSNNVGEKNKIASLPGSISFLNNLSVFICSGEPGNEWGINNLDTIKGLSNLTYLDLSYNLITEVEGLNNLSSLKHLLLASNQIEEMKGLSNFPSLQVLDLHANHITDLRPLLVLMQRENKPMQITWAKAEANVNVIIIYDNPVVTPPAEVLENGNDSVLGYYRQLDAHLPDENMSIVENDFKPEEMLKGDEGGRIEDSEAALDSLSSQDSSLQQGMENVKDGPNLIDDKIKALAVEYEDLRRSMPAGDNRTAMMTATKTKMGELAEKIMPALPLLTNSNSPGERLAAIAALQKVPDIQYVDWLSEHVADAERAFVGYHATVALLKASEKFVERYTTEMYAALSHALNNLDTAKNEDPNQLGILEDAMEIVQRQLESENSKTVERWWTSLKDLLCDLYYDQRRIAALWAVAGGQGSDVDLHGTAEIIWSRIIKRLRKKEFRKITAEVLLDTIGSEYPRHPAIVKLQQTNPEQSETRVKTFWVCQTWKANPADYPTAHIFAENTEDGFCPEDPAYHGILLNEYAGDDLNVSIQLPMNNDRVEIGTSITIRAECSDPSAMVEFFVDGKKIGENSTRPHAHSYHAGRIGEHVITTKALDGNGNSATSEPVRIIVVSSGFQVPEVGLCVLLLDASGPMSEPIYEGSPITRMRMVANSAASGIFDLERMENNPNAFIAMYKFDDRVHLMFVDAVANLIKRFDRDVKKFANYIYDELFNMQQGADINQALKQAHGLVIDFLEGQLSGFPLMKYTVMRQRILRHDTVESVSIPNVRVLIYTDGRQYDANGNRTLNPNPFIQFPIQGLNHDILLGLFFGNEDEEGSKNLQSLLSRCPIHDELQFFLLNRPGSIGNLKSLFRMASGASGFCPKCLERTLYR